MSVVSFAYHATYQLVDGWGDWLRHVDWILAMSTGPVFVNFFFLKKNSQSKIAANFWILFLVSISVTTIMEVPGAYVLGFAAYIIILFVLRSRRMTKIPLKLGVTVTIWISIGVFFFFISDYYIYWYFHTNWHIAAFFGLWTLLKVGPTEDNSKPLFEQQIAAPVIQEHGIRVGDLIL